jgi:ComF family protein
MPHCGPCGACQKAPPPFCKTVAGFVYTPLLAHLIQRLKFSHELTMLPFLVEALTATLRTAYDMNRLPVDWVFPVPLHARRQFWRGFNQAHEIARRVSQHLGLAYSAHHLRKIKQTPAQAGLSQALRLDNLRQSFRVERSVQDARIALVDDVMTTGTTLRELAQGLKRAGAREVHVWVLARALKT